MNFNKLKYIFSALICVFVINACNEDDLSLVNPNELTPETFLVTQAQVQSAVNAAYGNLQTRGLWSRHMFFSHDNMGHENGGNQQLEADKRQYLEFSFDPSHGAIRAFWESCFKGINKANYVINNEDKINAIAGMSTEDKNAAVGEAKFLRAFYYFMLVTRYGDVPLITVIPDNGDGFPKSSSSEIWAQIEADLTDAASMCKAKGDAENGRATKGAAYALLGKAHLYQGSYSEAKTAFGNVTGYSLVSDFYDNFKEETEYNDESIFEVVYDASLGTSAIWNSDANGLGLQEATFRGQEYGLNDWYNVFPAPSLLSAFEDGDPRHEDSFYTEGDILEATGQTIRTGTPPASIPDTELWLQQGRTAGWRKYQNYYKQANEGLYSGINFRVIRYADVLLMMAEVENQLGNTSAAVGYLNQVRDRVGMPRYGTPAMDSTYPVNSQAQVTTAIIHERQVELAGEQHRFPDLVRWGIAGDVLGQFGFVTGKHEHFPIPQNEINSNNALDNSAQNPGY